MKIASTEDRVYITPVKKGKEENFKKFLTRSLNIEDSRIQSALNGDFYIFNIDLSDKNDTEFRSIRKTLNHKQIAFLK